MGATVIHVGRPSHGRMLEPVGRNKRSIAVDLKTDAGRKIAHALVAGADVVVEGFRPGVAVRLAIDYDTLRKRNPKLVYCSLSGYGQDGPYAMWAGHDLNYQGVAGSIQFDEDGAPLMPSGPWSDRAAGYNLQIAILRGLVARQIHGEGRYFDVALVDATLTIPLEAQYSVQGVGRMPTGGMSGSSLPQTAMIAGGYCWYAMYECADARWLSVGCLEPQFWQGLCLIAGREDWIDRQFAERSEQEVMRRTLARMFASKARERWVQSLAGTADLPIAPVNSADEVASDPHLASRGSVLRTILPGDQEMVQVGAPMRTSTDIEVWRGMTVTGMDTVPILEELGWSADAVEELLADGVVEATSFPGSSR